MPDDARPSLPVRNPRTGEVDAQLQVETSEISARVERLRSGQIQWAASPIEARAAALIRLADALSDGRQALADALEADTGRRKIAAQEVDGVIASLRGWAGAAPHLISDPWTGGRSNPKLKHRPQFSPFPLVGVISPWNFPLTLSMIDTIPALLAGCAVLIKPSEVTPRFAEPLRQIIEAAGLSDVLALVLGDGATGVALIQHVDAVCFTGSVATGRKVALACAERLIPAFLELGGKDPLIVLPGADLEAATDAALRGSVLSTGQACQSIERIYVPAADYAAFLARLTEKAKAARLNWPEITAGEIGPIIFDKQADILQRHIDDAVAKGAQILSGGRLHNHGGGLWLEPTVLAKVDHAMSVMTEETFGPILPVMAYETLEEAIALANDSAYGLSAAVFGPDLDSAEAVARDIDAGAVSLNDAALTALFYEAEKHAFKASGLGGSRMGPAGFHRFLRRKALIANTGAPTPLAAFAEDA